MGTEKPVNSVSSNVPQGSSLFAYNQDVTKPLHTSDDKPFNFPTPQQPNSYNYEQPPNQYSQYALSRPPPNVPNQYNKNYPPPYEQKNPAESYPPPPERDRPMTDRFGRPITNSRPAPEPYARNEPPPPQPERNGSKFNTSFTPNFNSDKYAKYLEDEYDDSRFRDPEPSESPQYNSGNKFNNYGRDDRNNYQNYRQNYQGNENRDGGFQNKFDDFNKREFNDGNNRKEMGRGFRGRSDNRSKFGDRGKADNQKFDNFGNSRFGNRGFGRGAPNDGNARSNFNSWNDAKGQQDRFDNAEPPRVRKVEGVIVFLAVCHFIHKDDFIV